MQLSSTYLEIARKAYLAWVAVQVRWEAAVASPMDGVRQVAVQPCERRVVPAVGAHQVDRRGGGGDGGGRAEWDRRVGTVGRADRTSGRRCRLVRHSDRPETKTHKRQSDTVRSRS